MIDICMNIRIRCFLSAVFLFAAVGVWLAHPLTHTHVGDGTDSTSSEQHCVLCRIGADKAQHTIAPEYVMLVDFFDWPVPSIVETVKGNFKFTPDSPRAPPH